MKVLVVDDTPSAAQLLLDTLSTEGYDLVCAATGAECLELAERELPDVILLDVMLPGISGFEVCATLRTLPLLADVTIIMLTAHDDRGSRLKAFESGADDFLPKPFDRLELKLRLRTIHRLNRFRRLVEQQREYEDLTRLSPDGILSLDGDGVVLFGNPAASALVGLVAGKPLGQLFHRDDRQAVDHAWARVIHGREPMARLTARVAASGESYTEVEASLGRVAILSGRQRATLILRDISDRRALESQVDLLQRADMVAEAAAEVAHDTSNMLLGVQIALHRAGLHLPEESPAHAELDHAGDFIEKAGALLQSLSRFQREEDDEESAVVVDLNDEIHEAEPLLRTLAGDATLHLELGSEPLPVTLQPAEVHQILSNLVSNARDAIAGPGSIAIRTFTVSWSSPGGTPGEGSGLSWSFLTVTDTGSGMSDEVVRRVFDQYFTTKGDLGTGLGLPSVHRIVTRHGGTIEIDSRVGAGTTFTLGFPAAHKAVHNANS